MTGIPHAIRTGANGVDTIVAFNPNNSMPVVEADSNHPHWKAIVEGLAVGDESVFDLFDVAGGMMKRLRTITDRVGYDGTNILWDGDPVHTVIADQIKRALEAGESNYEALAKFWEKLESNPSEHSKTQAYDWLACHDFKITPEGDVVGYKGVSQSYVAEDGAVVYHSSWASRVSDKPSAYVNGKKIAPLSKVPQTIGDVVTMPRSEVKADPSQSCERGLHVATFNYAKSYGNTVVEVHVNPRDIVSVPTDASGAKVRVCKYTVVDVRTAEHTGASPVLSAQQSQWQGDVGYAPADF